MGDQTRRYEDEPKITAPTSGEIREEVPLPPRRCEDGTPGSHVRELQQKTRKIISRSVFVSPALWRFISLYPKQLTQFILCFLSLQRLLRQVVANKLLYSRINWWCLCVRHFFSWWSLQQGFDWSLRRSATLINYWERCCYTCLCGAVALHELITTLPELT